MPLVALFSFREDSMLKSIESAQELLKKDQFNQLEEKSKISVYASIFGMRAAANAKRDDKSSLKVGASLQSFEKNRDALMSSPTFTAFLRDKGEGEIQRLLKAGHGGAAEDAFREYVMQYDKLPADVPNRWMPTASERIQQHQKKLNNIDPKSDKAVEIYAEIFRSRRAVNAVRKNGDSVQRRIDGKRYAETEDLANNEVFKSFVKEFGGALRSEAQTGNGGAAEEMFQNHLLKSDHIPAGAPKDYMPTAENRLDMLKSRIKAGGTQVEQRLRCTEIMATREAVKAIRGEKASLAPRIKPEELDSAYEKWSKCETFQNFLKEKPTEAFDAATTGHGGKLGDEFKDYVLKLDHIPADVPDAFMPNADKRLEVLQDKYKEAGYNRKTDEEKLQMAAELMATREVVKAVRNNKKSLEKPVNSVELNEAVNRWTNCAAFKDFVKYQPEKVRSGAIDGHGGLMGDNFKTYVLGRNVIEEDIPVEFMPTAAARIDVLKKKIEINQNPNPQQKLELYAELMATRGSVDAVRKKTDALEKPVDPGILAREREKLTKCAAFKSFINDPELAGELRAIALEGRGHGGALEDKFKEYVANLDALPTDVPERYMPTAFERTEALQKKIRDPGFDDKENTADIYAELMAARDAVNAKRNKPDTLKVKLKAEDLQESLDQWKNCKSFREFVNDPDSGAKEAALAGHGGALAEKFQEYIKSMDVLPTDVPEKMLPDALDRIDALKGKLAGMDPILTEDEEFASLYAQILAARTSVNAKVGDKSTLKKQLNPENVNQIAESIENCSVFKDYLRDNREIARRKAASGHGGELEQSFKRYINTLPRMPRDVPQEYMPTAFDRIEGLQSRIDSAEFDKSTIDQKILLLGDLIGTRRSVGAERNKKETLNKTLSGEEVYNATDKMLKCTAFKEFVEKNPAAAKKAALSGHGGALEDAFKEYVKNMDRIPDDVPKEFMPTALERTEILKDKIKSNNFRNVKNMHEQNRIYKELIATRAAVNSVRGDKKSLNHVIDAKRLGEIRGQIYEQGTVNNFFEEANRKVLYDAAIAGHGGALEDKLKEDVLRQAAAEGVLTPTPERYRPKADQLRDRIKKNLDAELKVPNNPVFGAEKETVMKKVAAAMYLTKLEKQAKDNGQGVPVVNPNDMKTNVDTLMRSSAFKMMFEDENTAKNTAELVRDGRMSTVIEQLGNNKAALKEQREQRLQQQIQYQQDAQQELQQRHRANSQRRIPNQPGQNQQIVNDDNQIVNQNRPGDLQLEPEEQRVRRSNSLRKDDNRVLVPGLNF